LENALLFRRGAVQKTEARQVQIAGSERLRAGDVYADRSRMLSSMKSSEIRNEPAGAGGINVGSRRGLAFGWGLAAGIGTVMGALVGRKALMQASVGKGRSVKHRALDLAASVMHRNTRSRQLAPS